MGLSVIDNIMTVDGVPEKELFPTTFKKIFQIQRRKSLLFFLCDHPRSFKLQLLYTTCDLCLYLCLCAGSDITGRRSTSEGINQSTVPGRYDADVLISGSEDHRIFF